MKSLAKQKGFITIGEAEPPVESSAVPGYPFMTCGFAIGNGGDRRTIEPSKTNFASKNFAVHQMIWFSAEHYREARYGEFQAMWDINPNQVHIPHIDHHGIKFDPPNHGSSEWNGDEYVHARVAALGAGEFDKIIATGVMNRGEYTGGPYTMMQSFHHELAIRWDTDQATHEYMCEAYFVSWSNDYDDRTRAEGGVNLARDFKFGIMQDTFAQNASNGIQWFPEFEGTISAILNSNEFTIGAWAYPDQVSSWQDHFGGTDDGAGYYPNLHDVQVVIVSSNRRNSSSDDATGYNPTTNRIRLNGSPNYTYSVGDSLWIKVKQFEVTPTDKTSGQWDDDDYHRGGLYFLEGYNDIMEAEYGFRSGIYSNQVSQNANYKRLAPQAEAELLPVVLWQGKWDGLHWEHADAQIGFTGDWEEIGYWVKNSLHQRNTQDYDPNDIPLITAANIPLLKPDSASPTGYPCIWFNVEHVRKENWDNNGPGVEIRYAALTELDAAYVRFYSLMCWCMNNMASQPSMGAHADPVMIDEELIEAGDPITPRDFWENYDQTGNLGKGTYDWKPPDFGTHGYWFEFDNCAIQINFRVPTNINIAWIPSWMEGGQAIDPELDRMVLPYAGDGFKWQAFNRATYVNTITDPTSTYYQKTPSDYDPFYIMKDAELNNGKDRDVFFDTGALEAVIHMRVPTTGRAVTISQANRTLFWYKEKPIQLCGHQNVRHNVAYCTSHDIPAIQDVAGKIQLYFDLLASRGLNNIRLWPYFTSDTTNPTGPAAPLPWARPGPGTAEDGEPRFDLTIHNQAYFDRIDEICEEALHRDIIVTVLFWDVYGFHGGGGRGAANPFTNRSTQNNINSIETDINNNSMGLDGMYEGTVPANIEAIQIAYEEKLIDTVNKYPNIIYEVNNEQGRLPFQTDVMERIRAYEFANHTNNHLVALSAGGLLDTGNYTKTDVGKTALINSTCDVIMPGTSEFAGTWGDTHDASGTGPPIQDNAWRPWIMDMDHIEPHARRADHLWKSICRGYGYNNFESNDVDDPALSKPLETLGWEAFMTDTTYGFNIIRRNIGTAQNWMNNQSKDPLAMNPTDDISVSSTTYCLADPGEEYITFLPSGTSLTIKQLVNGQTYRYKWYDATLGVEEPGTGVFTAGAVSQLLSAPFTLGAHGAALHVWKIS